jgi:hypothetical protein
MRACSDYDGSACKSEGRVAEGGVNERERRGEGVDQRGEGGCRASERDRENDHQLHERVCHGQEC